MNNTPPLWPHQRDAIDFAHAHQGAMLAMDMGTGKTRVTIEIIEQLDEDAKVLILAPKSVVSGVWPDQYEQFGKERELVALDDSVKASKGVSLNQRRIQMAEAANIVVVNYEMVWRGEFANWVIRQPWRLLVMDESHRIKSPGGLASRFCSRLSDRVPQRIALTGTPMPHSPLDIYAQYRAINKNIFGTSFDRFKRKYAMLGGYNGHIIIGYQSLDELKQKYEQIAFQVTADEVLDLPEAIDSRRVCHLSPKAARAYQQMENDLVVEIDNGTVTASNALSRLLRLQQITSGYLQTEDGKISRLDQGKEELLGDLFEEIGQNEPIVVFARFRQDLRAIAEVARRHKRYYSEISGQAKDLSQWQEHGGVLAVQIQAGGLGLDLTQASCAVYYSLGFSLGDYQQSRARLRRPGQTRPIQYVHFLASNTVDFKVARALRDRQQVISRVVSTYQTPRD